MDSILTFIVDVFFFLIGRGALWVLKKLGLPAPDFGHSGTVVFGLVVLILLVLALFFLNVAWDYYAKWF